MMSSYFKLMVSNLWVTSGP